MEIKRFDTMFEASKKGTAKTPSVKKPVVKKPVVKKTEEEKAIQKEVKGNLKKQLHDFLVDELKKKKMSRSDMLKVLRDEFGDDKKIETTIENTVDDIMHDPMKTKLNVKVDKFKGGVKSDAKKGYPYFYIGDESKEPAGLEKEKTEPKEREVTKKGKKIEKFANFKDKKDKEEESKSKSKKEEKEEKSDKPKFGSPEWRELYAKKSSKKKEEPKEEDKKEKIDKPVKESRIPRFDKF